MKLTTHELRSCVLCAGGWAGDYSVTLCSTRFDASLSIFRVALEPMRRDYFSLLHLTWTLDDAGCETSVHAHLTPRPPSHADRRQATVVSSADCDAVLLALGASSCAEPFVSILDTVHRKRLGPDASICSPL